MGTHRTIDLFPDFKELIKLLNSEGVRYLLLGGYAVNYYGHHRATRDIDFWIALDPSNAERISAALQKFGFPSDLVTPTRFQEPNIIHMFGRSPNRVDLLTNPSGVEFEACYSRRVVDTLGGVEVSIISKDDLLTNKIASGRDKDVTDVKQLSGETKRRRGE